jgi:streptomycin 6-kinase
VLERDDDAHALLLELCHPGTPLSTRPLEEAMDVLVELLPRLWKDPTGFHTLEEEIEFWHDEGDLQGQLLDLARELAATQGERVLTNQDLHGDNVLAAQRRPWLVIDPKPLAAEREFAVAPIVRSSELGHSRREALYRLERLCSDLGLDRERARLWTIVQTTAWSEHRSLGRHVDVLEWLS